MRAVVYVSFLFATFACTEEKKALPKEVKWSKTDSSTLSKEIAENEEIKIKLFLEMHKKWKMEMTGTGLRYYVYEQGTGRSPKRKEIAEIEYEVTLLDGSKCYKTESDEYEELVVDQSDIETGVQEALKLLKVGDRAKLIIPSHIGHGLLGDQDKIPPLTTLVVDIYLRGIK
jgi:FKBP-type peptidyl-prolyl cis-trans isomerase